MFELVSPANISEADKLARGVLALQRVLKPQLKKQGESYPVQSSYGGIGNHITHGSLGNSQVEVRASLLTEQELEHHASVRIHDDSGLQFRIEVRGGALADVYDHEERRVEDEALLKKIRATVLRKRLAYRAFNLMKNIVR